jgi:hypothetical protein
VPCFHRTTVKRRYQATAYKKAATTAPKPRRLPAATLTLAAAPGVAVGEAPDAPEPERRGPDPDAPEPVASDPDVGVDATIWTVVLLLAETTTVRVWLNMEPVPGRIRVVMPVPTAGMSAGAG